MSARTILFFVAILGLLSMTASADMLYDFQFQDSLGAGTLANTGTAGGSTGVFSWSINGGSDIPPVYTSNTPPNGGAKAMDLSNGAYGIPVMYFGFGSPRETAGFKMTTAGDQITVATWIYLNSTTTSGDRGIVGNWMENLNNDWFFKVMGDNGNKLGLQVGGGTTYTDPVSIPLNTWVPVAFTWQAGGDLNLYVNGLKKDMGPVAAVTLPADYYTSPYTAYGWIEPGATSASSARFDGKLDNFQMYNTVLTQDQIRALAGLPALDPNRPAVWTGGGANTNWTNTDNWLENPPSTTGTAKFSLVGASTGNPYYIVTLDQDQTVGGLSVTGGPVNAAGLTSAMWEFMNAAATLTVNGEFTYSSSLFFYPKNVAYYGANKTGSSFFDPILAGNCNLTINAGNLILTNYSNSFTGNISVQGGVLSVGWPGGTASDSPLGNPNNSVTLGSAHSMGGLQGMWNGNAGITRSLTLNGLGGSLSGAQNSGQTGLAWRGPITGSGLLIVNGNSGAMAISGNIDNTSFTGGTFFTAGQTYVGWDNWGGGINNANSLGTGNVRIASGAMIYLTGYRNIDANATVFMQPMGSDEMFGALPAMRLYYDSFGQFLPKFDPTSSGMLWFDQDPSSMTAAFAGQLGSKMWLRSEGTGISVPKIDIWPDHLIRLTGDISDFNGPLVINSSAANDASPFVAGDSLVVGRPNTPGAARLSDDNSSTITGTVTVQPLSVLEGVMLPGAGSNSLGSPTGAVKINGGMLLALSYSGGQGIVKGATTTEGDSYLVTYGDGAQLTLDSLTPNNHGTVGITPWYGILGTNQNVWVTHGAPTPYKGMIDPHYYIAGGVSLSGNNYWIATGDFATYDGTNGFMPATYSTATNLNSPNNPTDDIFHATTANGDQSLTASREVYALRSDVNISGNTLTIGSGGLIVDPGAGGKTISSNLVFGSSSTPVEAVVNVTNPVGYFDRNNIGYYGPQCILTLSGTIKAAGLTMSGQGHLVLTADNSATLNGPITINGGSLQPYDDTALGNPNNGIFLNGGELYGLDSTFTRALSTSRTITLGPLGGTLFYVNAHGKITGQGPLELIGYATSYGILYSNDNDYTGGTILQGTNFVYVKGKVGLGDVWIRGTSGLYTDNADALVHTVNGQNVYNGVILEGGNGSLYCDVNTGDGLKVGSIEGNGLVLLGYSWNFTQGAISVGWNNRSTDFYGSIGPDTYGGFGRLTKEGTGMLTLWGVNSYYGMTTVHNGTLVNNNCIDGPVTVTPGAAGQTPIYDGKGTTAGTVTVNTGGMLQGSGYFKSGLAVNGGTVNVTDAVVDPGVITGTSNVGLWMDTGSLGGSSTINGDSTIRGGSISGTHTFNGSLTVYSVDDSVTLSGAGTRTVNGPLSLNYFGFPISISGTTVVNNPGGNLTLPGGCSMSGSNTINLGAGAGTMWTNDGSGSSTFSGSGTFTGNYFVEQPNTVVSGTYTFNSNVQVNGGTFKGNHTIHGNLTTAAGSHAIVAPSSDVLSAGTMTVVGNVALGSNTAVNFNLASPGTTGSGINDLIDITGNLSLDGTLNVNALSGFGAGTYRLFNYTGTLTGSLAQGVMPADFTYTIDTTTPNQVNLGVTMPYITGDTDHSGGSTLNSLDIDAIYHHFGQAYTTQWKVAQDTNPVGQEDVTYELVHLMHTNYGDANLDRFTDFTDFQVLLDHWQAPGGWASGDFNGDGTVDFLDFQVLLDYWNPGGWNGGTSQVPEPATLSLLALGGLALLRRKK